ncbi:hypothetical protein [Chlorobaculum limnaeum]|uniref:hypothetical protein n=1 Tax=Chlorobaculum limnaeum TaxID=274537 RepID=UPI003AAC8A70
MPKRHTASPYINNVCPGIPPKKDTELKSGNTRSASLASACDACKESPSPASADPALTNHLSLVGCFIALFFLCVYCITERLPTAGA